MILQHQYKSVHKQIDQLVSENDRLTSELEQLLEDRLQPLLAVTSLPGDSELSAIDNLQTQLSLITQVGRIWVRHSDCLTSDWLIEPDGPHASSCSLCYTVVGQLLLDIRPILMNNCHLSHPLFALLCRPML